MEVFKIKNEVPRYNTSIKSPSTPSNNIVLNSGVNGKAFETSIYGTSSLVSFMGQIQPKGSNFAPYLKK